MAVSCLVSYRFIDSSLTSDVPMHCFIKLTFSYLLITSEQAAVKDSQLKCLWYHHLNYEDPVCIP